MAAATLRLLAATACSAGLLAVAADPTPAVPAVTPLPPIESISDAVITARIRAALLSDPALDGADVSVATTHGAVILNGTVKSYEQSGIASSHAQRQDGVMGVDNQLSLRLQ